MAVPFPPLVTGSGLIGLLCACCAVPFQRGDVVRERVTRVTPGPDGCVVEADAVHHRCEDPQAQTA